jgi:outer membrane lipoprotein-sorting protein
MSRPTLRTTFALLLLTTASLRAQAPAASSLARLVDNHYNHLQSLQTRYTERYQGLGMDRSETGTLTLRKPGRMRWAYGSPQKSSSSSPRLTSSKAAGQLLKHWHRNG